MTEPRAKEPADSMPAEDAAALERRYWRFSLRTVILAIVIGIITLLATVLTYTAWHYSSANAKALSGRLMSRIADHVVYRTTRYLEPAETGATLSRKMSSSGVVRQGDFREIEKLFLHLLEIHPQLAMLNYGDEQGNFIMVKRFPVDTRVKGYRVLRLRGGVGDPVGVGPFTGPASEAALRETGLRYLWGKGFSLAAKVTPSVVPAGSLSTKIVRRVGAGSPVVLWKYRDGAGEMSSLWVGARPTYDPRPRPWYAQSKKTRRQGWTPVYLFFTDKKPGIASATPIFAPDGSFIGAVSVEIELFRLSEFLAARRLGPRSSVVLINDKKQVVAYSDTAKFRKRVDVDGRPRWVLRTIDEVPDRAVVRSFEELARRSRTLPPTRQHIFSFEQGGETWQALYVPFPTTTGNHWTVGLVVPEDAFLGQIKRNRWMAVLISLLVSICAMLLAVFLSRSISQPLHKLVKETERIRELDLQSTHRVESALSEVSDVASAVDNLKVGLRSFEKYVPRELVRQLVFSGEEARVQGETRELSILFTDIAGFTSIAEGLSPEALVAHLNRYFNAATKVLLDHGATIDKYIGDAIMVFWGAPRERLDHPEAACHAALGLQRALDELNADWERSGQPAMHTRIGVHTGEVIVGNIGSEERLSYTIIGDSVNLASRIESINKQYGTQVLVSEHSWERVKGTFVGRAVDVVAVKGRSSGVLLYELRGLRAEATTDCELETLCGDAMASYLDRRWEDALGHWGRALTLLGGSDQPIERLMERVRELLEEPPPRDWSGTHQATQK